MVRRPHRHFLTARRVGPLLACVFAVVGCQGFEDLDHAPGDERVLDFPHSSPEAVLEAAYAAALKRPDIRVTHIDRDKHILHLTVPVNWWDWGQRLGVRIDPANEAGVQVTIKAISAVQMLPITPHAAERYARELEHRLASDWPL